MNHKFTFFVWSFLSVCITASAVQAQDVQSVLLRSVTVTCKLEESIAFYRDILGQQVIEDQPQSAESAARFLNISPTAKVRFVVMKGSGVYPGGEIIGGRVAFMGIDEPKGPACKDAAKQTNQRGVQGSEIHPHRVSNIEEIARRAKEHGVEILVPLKVSGSRLSRNMMMFDPNGRIVEVFEVNIAKIPDAN
ncbi:MAG: VOC family protein [Rhodospirillaceae bacterium]|nr:VOC family protein [Rhodospirillaceae bacterium]